MNGETLTGLLKKRTDDPCTGGGLRKPGWMPGFSWNMSQEKAGRIILHTEKKVSQKVLLKDIWN